MAADKHHQGLKLAESVAAKAIWLEGVLVIAKILVGWLSQSLVLISDAVHSTSDIINIITSWLGLKIAQKKPDKKFAYGYYKAENLGTLLISLIILYAGWQMLTQGYGRLFTPSDINLPILALGISLIDAIILFIFGKYEIKIGRQTGTQSLTAMGEENRTHIFSSSAVFIGTLAAYLNIPYIEGAITIAISLLVIRIGLKTIKKSSLVLMDISPAAEIEQQILRIIQKVSGVEEAYDLKLRRSGPFILGEVKVGIRKKVDVTRAHQIADKIETKIKKQVPTVDSLTVHVEPFQSDFRHLVIPVGEKQGLSSPVASQLSRCPYLLFVNLKGKEIKGHYFLSNPYRQQKQKAGLAVAKMIVKQKSDTVITDNIGEIAYHALQGYLFDIYQTKGKIAKQVIEEFIKGELNRLVLD